MLLRFYWVIPGDSGTFLEANSCTFVQVYTHNFFDKSRQAQKLPIENICLFEICSSQLQ